MTARAQLPADIARCVEAGDLEGAKRTAHMLKGSAGTVGLVMVQGIAARLEGLLQQQLTTPRQLPPPGRRAGPGLGARPRRNHPPFLKEHPDVWKRNHRRDRRASHDRG